MWKETVNEHFFRLSLKWTFWQEQTWQKYEYWLLGVVSDYAQKSRKNTN